MITSPEKSVDADVLGPAYSFNQPSDAALAGGQPLAQAFKQTWDAATNAWVQSLQKAWQSPFGFGGLMWSGLNPATPAAQAAWKPDFSVTRDGHAITVSAMLPGATEDDVNVEIIDGKLEISGQCNFNEAEGASDRFRESIDLMNAVDSRSVEARIGEDGFLEVSLKLHGAPDDTPPASTPLDTPVNTWGANEGSTENSHLPQ